MRGKNLWPQPDHENLKEQVPNYMAETQRIAEKLLEILGLFLGLDEHYFSTRLTRYK